MEDQTLFERARAKTKQKVQEAKWKAQYGVRRAVYWMSDNKEFVAAAAPFVGAGVPFLWKIGKNVHQWRKEAVTERKKTLRVWDPVLGFYWDLKRPMTSNEQLEFSARRRRGETTGDILRNMRILTRK